MCAPGGEHILSSPEFGDKEGMCEEGLAGEFDRIILLSFSLLYSLEFCAFRPQTLSPSEPTELNTNLTAMSDVSRGKITTY